MITLKICVILEKGGAFHMTTDMTKIDNNWIYQSNKLIEASYALTLTEQKLIRMLASMVSKNDKDFESYEFKQSDLKKVLGISNNKFYKELDNMTDTLMQRIIKIKKVNGNGFDKYHWVDVAHYSDGILKLKIHPDMKLFYMNLCSYTKYQLKNIMQFKSTYSFRIYELLKQYEKLGERKISIDELRTKLDLEASEYPKYANLKQRILLQAQKEINSKTDIKFEFEEIKACRRVEGVKFTICGNIPQRNIDEPIPGQIDMQEVLNSDRAAAADEGPIDNMMTEKELLELKAIFTEHELSNQAICSIYEDSKKDIGLVRQCYLQCLENKSTIENVVGYMRKLVKDYEPSIQHNPTKQPKKNKFLNFPQTKYNFDEIEQLEMKRQVEKLRKEGILLNGEN